MQRLKSEAAGVRKCQQEDFKICKSARELAAGHSLILLLQWGICFVNDRLVLVYLNEIEHCMWDLEDLILNLWSLIGLSQNAVKECFWHVNGAVQPRFLLKDLQTDEERSTCNLCCRWVALEVLLHHNAWGWEVKRGLFDLIWYFITQWEHF